MARSTRSGSRPSPAVLDWLLEPDQPAVQYRTLVQLLGRRESDSDVKKARSRIGRVGWAAELLRRQKPKGYWERREPRTVAEYVDFLYFPPYLSTNWHALVLAELGMDSKDPRIRRVADLLFEYKLRLSSPFNFYHEEVCIVGNCARTLTCFGFGDDRRVRKLYDWLIEDQRADGGWSCSQGTPGTLDAWEALAAFAVVPRSARSPAMTRAIERGAEFYLRRQLFREGARYDPWFRLHYPSHYLYDILVGLDVLTELGYGGELRLRPAVDLLLKKRRPDGTWSLDRQHPDLGPGLKIYSDMSKVRPLVLERTGRPSKLITLRALRVLKRIEDAH
jgi:hypothetical protein